MGWQDQALAAEPQVAAEGAALLDLSSGKLLWSKEPDKQLAPASTTKILTALVALEKGDLDQVMTTSREATRVDGTRVYLVEGEQKTLRDLLYAMMLNSANDAAVVVAENLAGSVKSFAELMNKRAVEAGAKNSSFVTPNGLDDAGHHTTARDLGLIAVAAMKNQVFREIVITNSMPWPGQQWQSTLANHNRLLGSYEGAIGVKTGYTIKAGQTLVAAASRGQESFLAVILNSKGQEVWSDAKKLLDYGFANFIKLPLAEKGQVMGGLKVPRLDKDVPFVAGDSLIYLVGKAPVLPRMELNLNPLEGPIDKGQQVGEAIYYLDGQEVGRVRVISQEAVPPLPPPPRWKDWFIKAVLALFLLRFINFVYMRRRRRRKRVWSYSR